MATTVVDQMIEEQKQWDEKHRPFDVMQTLPHYVFVPSQGGSLEPLKDIPEGVQGVQPWKFSDHALTQTLERLQFPRDFYNRLSDNLKFANANYLIQHGAYTKQLMLRAQDGNVLRAVMSKSYERFDNLALLEAMRPFANDDMVLRWQHRDDLSMHLSISYRSTQTQIRVGDVVETGLHVSNSEVGLRSVTIAVFVYILRCTNRAISREGGELFRLRHTGDGDILHSAVQSAMTDVYLKGQGVIDRIKKATTLELPDPRKKINEVGKEARLTKAELDAVINSYNAEPGGTLWDVSQAFSRTARGVEPERSYELSQLAADVLPKAS